MHGRVGAALVVASTLVAALAVVGTPALEADAAKMCPPVTIEDLFPSTTEPASGQATTSSSTPDTTTTPSPTSTVTTEPADSSTVATTPGTGSTPQEPKPSSSCVPFSYEMTWPLAGEGQIVSGFGSPRDGGERHHQGNDIVAPKLAPVLAVADGVVMKVTQEVGTDECCYLSLRHDDGWQSYYVHLNNDRWGTDDGMGVGVRTDLVEGAEVSAGDVIGWVGDSGNAEETVVHLHFELRTPAGEPVDPGASLQDARRNAEIPEQEPGWPYADDDGTDTEWLAAEMLTEGLFMPCDETKINFCPRSVASPEFATEIVNRITGKTPPGLVGTYQSTESTPNSGIRPSRTLEEAFGCAPIEECLDYGIPESELARLAVWVRLEEAVTLAFPVEPAFESTPKVTLPSTETAETWLREDGIIDECNAPLDDAGLLTRGEALTLLASWLRGVNPEPCIVAGQRTR